MNLFCGCNTWRMCLHHGAESAKSIHNGVRWVRVDIYQEYMERVRALEIMARFRQVLAVIAWAAQWCPRSGGDHLRHEGAFYDLVCRETTAMIDWIADDIEAQTYGVLIRR
jgi:hypothetical protein